MLSLDTSRYVRWMHLSQHKLCTRKIAFALEVEFYLDFHWVTRQWWRTLTKEVTSNMCFRGVGEISSRHSLRLRGHGHLRTQALFATPLVAKRREKGREKSQGTRLGHGDEPTEVTSNMCFRLTFHASRQRLRMSVWSKRPTSVLQERIQGAI